MFTGIIEAIGTLESLERTESGGRVRVGLADAAKIAAELRAGDSIAVNGCCLTVVERNKRFFCADLSLETLRRTSFGAPSPDRRARAKFPLVNVERPLAAGARLGGHFVQGHVDGIGHVERLDREGASWWLSVTIPQHLRRYVAEKGSLAVDGVSLTVARCEDGVAGFAIVPFTYEHTNARGLAAGDAVNLECDILAKYAESLLGARVPKNEARLTIASLVEQGF